MAETEQSSAWENAKKALNALQPGSTTRSETNMKQDNMPPAPDNFPMMSNRRDGPRLPYVNYLLSPSPLNQHRF